MNYYVKAPVSGSTLECIENVLADHFEDIKHLQDFIRNTLGRQTVNGCSSWNSSFSKVCLDLLQYLDRRGRLGELLVLLQERFPDSGTLRQCVESLRQCGALTVLPEA